jgi:hypothetical protein
MAMTPDEAEALRQCGSFVLIFLALYAAVVALIADYCDKKPK